MARVLYCVSPIGLGHATRAIAVAEELRSNGLEVFFASGGNALDFLAHSGLQTEDAVRLPTPTVRGGEMKRTSLWYLRYWNGYRATKARVRRVVERVQPDFIVGDEEFSSVSLAMEMGLKHALVTDELELGFARTFLARSIERRVSRWYGDLLSKAALVILPDAGQDVGNRRHVGPIVRKVTRTREEVLSDYHIPRGGPIVLLSLSGSGIGGRLLQLTAKGARESGVPGIRLIVTGNRGSRFSLQGVYDLGVVRDNQNLVAAADIVVSNAGKSTIDEATSSGTPMIPIPIRNHAEQERNAVSAGYTDGLEERLGAALANKIGRREAPHDFRGAEKASRLIVSQL